MLISRSAPRILNEQSQQSKVLNNETFKHRLQNFSSLLSASFFINYIRAGLEGHHEPSPSHKKIFARPIKILKHHRDTFVALSRPTSAPHQIAGTQNRIEVTVSFRSNFQLLLT